MAIFPIFAYERLVQPNGGEDVPHNAVQHRVLCFGEFIRVHSIMGISSGLNGRGERCRVVGVKHILLLIAVVMGQSVLACKSPYLLIFCVLIEHHFHTLHD